MFYVVCITFNKMQTFPTIRSACVCTSHVVFRKDKPDAIPIGLLELCNLCTFCLILKREWKLLQPNLLASASSEHNSTADATHEHV